MCKVVRVTQIHAHAYSDVRAPPSALKRRSVNYVGRPPINLSQGQRFGSCAKRKQSERPKNSTARDLRRTRTREEAKP